MKFQGFWERKEKLCKIYNGNPGIIKEPHEMCPFKVAMKSQGIENDVSCHDFIAGNPAASEEILKRWEEVYEYPTNAEVFLRILNECDCRYDLDGETILFEGKPIGTLSKKWIKKSSKGI